MDVIMGNFVHFCVSISYAIDPSLCRCKTFLFLIFRNCFICCFLKNGKIVFTL